MKQKKFTDIFDDFPFSKTEYYFDGMSTEIEKHQFIFLEKIDEDIIILFENLEDENQFLSVMLLDKMFGMETEFVL
ncbi:MAG: hypothetical protein LBQ24_06290 [Candidatus Peribacteria bacterium]|nr:hypothetical protein [Candidatus Peribacteria bacterium]